MKILSLIDRVKGEVVDLGGKRYDFQRDAEGRFYMEVDEPAHIRRFVLEIPETFALYPGEALTAEILNPKAAAAKPVAATPAPAPNQDDDEDEDEDEYVPPPPPTVSELDAVRAEYKALTGKEASPNAGIAVLRRSIASHRAKAVNV